MPGEEPRGLVAPPRAGICQAATAREAGPSVEAGELLGPPWGAWHPLCSSLPGTARSVFRFTEFQGCQRPGRPALVSGAVHMGAGAPALDVG